MSLIMRMARLFCITLATGSALLATAVAQAAQPRDWEMTFQPAATPSMERMTEFHNLLLVIITLITVFVLVLLLYVMWRFSEKRNPVPSRTTHNTLVEVLWTVVPVIILVGVAVPSFRLLYYLDRIEDADITIKAIGHQWYWSYEYPDNGDIRFDSIMIADSDLKPGQPRLLTTDTAMVVPVGAKVRLLVTASDVLHAWAMPSFGVKMDAVPGRINETWFQVTRPGTYYGQCSELCGTGHAYMPIMVQAVLQEDFDRWVASGGQAAVDAETAERRIAATASK